MKPYCFASSSSGNCYILEFEVEGVPTRLMVECGIAYKDIVSKLSSVSLNLTDIDACLITHAHGDHSKAAHDIAYRGVPLFAHTATLEALKVRGEELVEYKAKTVCEGVKVMAFPVEHDCEGAVGFVIKTPTECVIFINDHKRWTCNLSAFKPDYIFIECNYFPKVVYAQYYELKKKGNRTIEEEQKMHQHERNLNSHCSLHGTIEGLKKLNTKNTKCIFLMHLSDRYANEYEMKEQVQLSTNVLTLVCGKGGGMK